MANNMWLSRNKGIKSSRLETKQNCDNELFKEAASVKTNLLVKDERPADIA